MQNLTAKLAQMDELAKKHGFFFEYPSKSINFVAQNATYSSNL